MTEIWKRIQQADEGFEVSSLKRVRRNNVIVESFDNGKKVKIKIDSVWQERTINFLYENEFDPIEKKQDSELEDFPLGCVVRTPTGCVGVVVKHRMTSKIDHFCRIDVQFSANPRDGVVLQPKYLELMEMPPEDYKPPFQFQTATARARVVDAVSDAKRKAHDCETTLAAERIKSEQPQPLAGDGKTQEIVPVGVLGINEERQDQSRLAGNDPRLADVRSA